MGYHTERVRLPNGDIAVLKSRPSNYPKDSAGWSAASLLALGVGIYYLTKFALSYADASVNRDLHQNA
jgi:hypothetical protein